MTDNELLLAISDIMDKKLEPVTAAIAAMQNDIAAMQNDITAMQNDIRVLQNDMDTVKQKVKELDLKLENVTNHNIQLLAENHINLVDKLNQAIRVSDKTLLYEVQVSSLTSKVERLEKEIAEIKNYIA